MTETTVVISDYYELLALHRTIMETKFAENPIDSAVQRSPFVAAVADRVLDALIEWERRARGEEAAEGIESWREADPSRREWVWP